MSRLLVDDVTKTDARALLNVNKMATISDIVAPSNEYIYASGANELTVVEGCVIAVGGAGIFKTANTILTAANLDAGNTNIGARGACDLVRTLQAQSSTEYWQGLRKG